MKFFLLYLLAPDATPPCPVKGLLQKNSVSVQKSIRVKMSLFVSPRLETTPPPQLEIMLEAKVWREAATQVFFALGLGFGGVIAFSSYNKRDNNCHFDAVLVSFINFFTSVLATLVVFAVLGFKANIMIDKCVLQ